MDRFKWLVPIKLLNTIAKRREQKPKERLSINEAIYILNNLPINLETKKPYSTELSKIFQQCIQYDYPIPKELELLYNESCRIITDMICD